MIKVLGMKRKRGPGVIDRCDTFALLHLEISAAGWISTDNYEAGVKF